MADSIDVEVTQSPSVTVEVTASTTDYSQLTNKPSINSVTLTGNKSLSDLSIQHELEAGDNITIEDNVISATDTVQYYYASDGLDLDEDTFSVNIQDGEDVLTIEQGQLKIDQSNINTSEINNDAGFLTSHQDISGKLDKVTTTTGYNQVYVKLKNGTQSQFNVNNVSGGSNLIPVYGDASRLIVGTPNENRHATPKSYVDDLVATKQDTLTAGTGISIVNNVISVNLTNADTEDF